MLRPSGKETLKLISLGKHPNSQLKAFLFRRRSKGSGVVKAEAKPPRNRRYGASLKIGIGMSKTRGQSHCASTVIKSTNKFKGPRQRRSTNQGAPSSLEFTQFPVLSTPMAPLPMAKAMLPSKGSVMSGVAIAAPGPLEACPTIPSLSVVRCTKEGKVGPSLNLAWLASLWPWVRSQ